MNGKLIAYLAASALVGKGIFDIVGDYYNQMRGIWMHHFRNRCSFIDHNTKYILGDRKPIYEYKVDRIEHSILTNSRYSVDYLPYDYIVWMCRHSYRYNFQFCKPIYDEVTNTNYYTAYCYLHELSIKDVLLGAQINKICTFDNPIDNLAIKPKNQRLREFLVYETHRRFGHYKRYRFAEWIH